MARFRSPSVATAALLLGFVLAGCAAGRPPAAVVEPSGGWTSAVDRAHPLVGRVLDVSDDRAVSWDEVAEAVAAADVVLLGEQHDNVDHHRLQQRLLEGMIAAGRRPAVAFEQLDLEDQAAVDRARASDAATTSGRAEALAAAVEWDKSGWPPFDDYRGLFETALAAALPIRAANLPRRKPGTGTGFLPETCTCPGFSVEALEAEIVESHCGYADDRMVAAMVGAQKRRDHAMAAALAPFAPAPGAVLVCGFGHARRDYGVPLHLAAMAPGLDVVAVAFVEVQEEAGEPAAYAALLHAASLPFDYVVFTPAADDEDPCEKFRTGLEKMKAR
ncbi:MAG: ChaN family lipoprotein [Candidatus Binatia bacterium]